MALSTNIFKKILSLALIKKLYEWQFNTMADQISYIYRLQFIKQYNF